MNIYVFDRELNLKGIVENHFSLIWTRRYAKTGEFELHCSLNSESANLLQEEDIVWKNDSLEAGVIEYRHLGLDDEGKEAIVVKGRFLTGLLGRRITWNNESLKDTAESVMRSLILNNVINPSDLDRRIDLLKLGDLKNYGMSMEYSSIYKNLLEEIENIAISSGLGVRTLLNLDSKNAVIDIYKGLDRTSSQNTNPRAIFSKEFENILEQEYIDSLKDWRNIALVAGEGEGSERELVVEGNSTGLDRREVFVDARDLQRENQTINDYKLKLKERGRLKLSELAKIETFESKVNLSSNLTYKEDFDLGDIITYNSRKWGITLDARIVEIEEVYEKEGLSIDLVFGESIPDLKDKIKMVVT